jgi:hypothetical protein
MACSSRLKEKVNHGMRPFPLLCNESDSLQNTEFNSKQLT